MIVKFHNRGGGHGRGPVEYLLGKDFQRDRATLLRGDPHQTIDLINASDFAKRYTSGVLSFKEKDIPGHQKQAIMDDFERVLLAGLEPDQYDILWVEHQDKDRLELNFVIPNTELTTGKRLQPYYHAADKRRVNAWQNVTNAEYGFYDPNDPANKRLSMILPEKAFEKRSEAMGAITAGLTALAEQGVVKDRESVLQALSEAGFNVVRETNKSISIADPDGGKNLRLKGAFYERDFRFGEGLREQIEAASAEFTGSADKRIAEYRADLKTGIKLKREANQKRYSNKRKSPEPEIKSPESIASRSHSADYELDFNRKRIGRGTFSGLDFLANPQLLQRPENSSENRGGRAGSEPAGDSIRHHSERNQRNSEQPNSDIFAAGVTPNDGAGTGLIGRIKKTIGRAQSAASSFIEGASSGAASFIENAARTVERIQQSFTGLRTNEDGMSAFKRTGEDVEQASIRVERAHDAISRACEALEQANQHTNYQGLTR